MNVIQLSEMSTNSYNLSDISLSPRAFSSNSKQTGGFFWSATGGNINDINYKDASERTLLHYIAMTANADPAWVDKLASAGVDLNAQDSQGNTALILATRVNNQAFIQRLLDKGANRNIANKEGFGVGTESPQQAGGAVEEGNDNSINNIINLLLKRTKQANQSNFLNTSEGSLGGNLTQNSAKFVDLNDSELNSDTTNLIKQIEKTIRGGGDNGCGCGSASGCGSDAGCGCGNGNEFNKFGVHESLDGGARGKRRVRREASDSRSEELGKMIDQQASKLHDQTKEKIKLILTENKKEFSIKKNDDIDKMIRAYKAALWQMVKEKFPDIKSNFDMSVELEKLATKENLKQLDIDKWMQVVKDADEKRKSKQETRPKKNSRRRERTNNSEQISATSTVPINMTDNLSETSFS